MNEYKSQIKTIELKLQHFVKRMKISPRLVIENVSTDVMLDNFCLDFEARIHARMAGQIIQTYKHPKTWLDAFKERWFPKFLLERYPVEYVIIKTWECYPAIRLPEWGDCVQFFVLENQSYDRIEE